MFDLSRQTVKQFVRLLFLKKGAGVYGTADTMALARRISARPEHKLQNKLLEKKRFLI